MSRQTSLEEHIRPVDHNVCAQAVERARRLQGLQSNKFFNDYRCPPHTSVSPVVVNSLFGSYRSFGSKHVDADEGFQSFLRQVYDDVNAFTSECNGSISVSHPNCVHRLVLDIDAEISNGYKDKEEIDNEFKVLIDRICHELFLDFTDNNCNKPEFVQEWMTKIKVFISFTRIRTRSRDVSKAGAHVVFHNFPMWPEFSKFFGNKVVEFICEKLKSYSLPWCKGGIEAIIDSAIYKENSTSLRLYGVQKVKECTRCPKPPNGGFPIWQRCKNVMCMAGKAWEHNSNYRSYKNIRDKHYTLKLDKKRKQPDASTQSFFLKDNTNNSPCPSDNPISNHCLVMLRHEREWVLSRRSDFEALFLNWCIINMTPKEHARLKKLKRHPNEIPTIQHLHLMKMDSVDAKDVDYQEILPSEHTRSIFEEISNCLDCYSSGIFTIQPGDRVVNTIKRRIIWAFAETTSDVAAQVIQPMTVGVASRCNTVFWRSDKALYEWNKYEQIFVEDTEHIGIIGVGSKVSIDGVIHEVKETTNFADVKGKITLVENFAHSKKQSKLVYCKSPRPLGLLMQGQNNVHVWDEFVDIEKLNESKTLIEKTVSCTLAAVDTATLGEMNAYVSWDVSSVATFQFEDTGLSKQVQSKSQIRHVTEVFSCCERYPQMGPKLEVSSVRSWKKRAHLFLKNGLCFNKGDQRHSSHTGMVVVVKDDTTKGMFPVCNCFCNKERGNHKRKCSEFNRNSEKQVINAIRDKVPYNSLHFWKSMPKDNPFNFVMNNVSTGTAMEETNRVYGPELFGQGLQPFEKKRNVKSRFTAQRLPDPMQVSFFIWNFNTCQVKRVNFAHLKRLDNITTFVTQGNDHVKIRQACMSSIDAIKSMQCDVLPTIRRNLSIGVKPVINDENPNLVVCKSVSELQGFRRVETEQTPNKLNHNHLWELYSRISAGFILQNRFDMERGEIIHKSRQDILSAVLFRQEAKKKKTKMEPTEARKHLNENVLFQDPDDDSEQASVTPFFQDSQSEASDGKSLGYESEVSDEGSAGSLADFIDDSQ